ncbi:hypothetical protein [Lachnospira multipara]|uniref:Uncharacterized protein n=1 Tax=Lachnospira multipara TaxID=28051 RepID=A0A1H5RJS7_9FIRM|nr:hypothetical protein [Lachnospira multipara]SEF38606.1 hypothetical protein SAMN05216537_10141 [Lachnospira multipara]
MQKKLMKFLIITSFALCFFIFEKKEVKAETVNTSEMASCEQQDANELLVTSLNSQYTEYDAQIFLDPIDNGVITIVGIRITYSYTDGEWAWIKNVGLDFNSINGYAGTSYSSSRYGGGSNSQDYCIRKFSITNLNTGATAYYDLYVYLDIWGNINYEARLTGIN